MNRARLLQLFVFILLSYLCEGTRRLVCDADTSVFAHFNGSAYARLQPLDSTMLQAPLTVAIIVRFNASDAGAMLVSMDACTQRGGALQFGLNANGNVRLSLWSDACTRARHVTSFTRINPNRWYTLTATWAEGLLSVGVDGVEDARASIGSLRLTSLAPLLIGASRTNSKVFCGDISLLAILSKRLTMDELDAHRCVSSLIAESNTRVLLNGDSAGWLRADDASQFRSNAVRMTQWAHLEALPFRHCLMWWASDAAYESDSDGVRVRNAHVCTQIVFGNTSVSVGGGLMPKPTQYGTESLLCVEAVTVNTTAVLMNASVGIDLHYENGSFVNNIDVHFPWISTSTDVERRCVAFAIDWHALRSVLVSVQCNNASAQQASIDVRQISIGSVGDEATVRRSTSPLVDPNRREVELFFARATLQPMPFDVTYATQLSVDRLDRLKFVAQAYRGPVSACVFIRKAERRKQLSVLRAHRDASADLRRFVDIHVVYSDSSHQLYPVNHLRNIAAKAARTQRVFHCDADFVPIDGMHARLSSLPRWHTERMVAVVPAFELDVSVHHFPATKSELLSLARRGLARQIHVGRHRASHGAVDYRRWALSSTDYAIRYERYFEPYVVMYQNVPYSFDERFEGYGNDKDSFHFVLNAANFTYIVLSDVFVVHYAHAPTDWAIESAQPSLERRARTFFSLYDQLNVIDL